MLKQAYVDRKFFKTFGNNLLDLCDGLDENRFGRSSKKAPNIAKKAKAGTAIHSGMELRLIFDPLMRQTQLLYLVIALQIFALKRVNPF